MSRFLVTDDNPDGYKLEDILSAIPQRDPAAGDEDHGR